MSHNKNKNAKRAFIYIRYLLPIVLCALLIGSMFISCLSFSTVEGTQREISEAELLNNTWEQVRAYLFANNDKEVTQESFAWTALILIPILVLLFTVGVLSSVVVAVVAVMYINNPEFRKSDTRIWFITLLPNRIVACVLQALVLPLLFYSRIIILLYDKIMNVDVLLNLSFPEPWVWGLIAVLTVCVTSAVSAGFERELGCDTFKKIDPPIVKVIDPEDSQEEEKHEPQFKTESERIYYENQMRAREEQAEYIRKLLNKNDEEEK